VPDDLRPIAEQLGVDPRFVDDYLPADFTAAFLCTPLEQPGPD
jgi:hypothetical protein